MCWSPGPPSCCKVWLSTLVTTGRLTCDLYIRLLYTLFAVLLDYSTTLVEAALVVRICTTVHMYVMDTYPCTRGMSISYNSTCTCNCYGSLLSYVW